MRTSGKTLRPGLIGPAALALFVNAGSIKSHPLLAWLPVDLTIVLGVILILSAFRNLHLTGYLSRAIWVPVIVGAAMTFGLVSAVTPYGVEKGTTFFTITILAMVAAVVLLKAPSQRAMFLRTLAVLGVVVAFLVTVAPEKPAEWSSVVTLAGTNTISTSQMILAAAIVISMDVITNKRRAAKRVLLALLAAILIYTGLSTGSRGPVVSVVIGVIVALLLAPGFKRRRGRSVIALAALGATALFIATQTGGEGLTRVVSFLAGDQDTSTMARSSFWRIAWTHVQALPTGGGWGYFGTLPEVSVATGEGGQLYPHNLVLEIALEAGWVAGIAFILLVAASVLRLIIRARDGITLTFFVLLVFTVINAMVSGDINDNRLMWVLLAVAWLVPTKKDPHPTAGVKVGALGRQEVMP